MRAWTSGYDLWHPPATVCRHDCSGNPREWAADPEWVKRYEATKVRLARLYAGEDLGAYGLGSARSLAEQGFSLAQFNLGFLYAKGKGVPKDYVEAYA